MNIADYSNSASQKYFLTVFTPNAKFFAHSRCRRSFVAPHIIICRCASFVEFVAPQQDNHHCMSLPFVEEGETSEDPTQYIHNILMTTEEAVNEVLNRQRLINRWNTQDRKHSNTGKQTPRSPIPMRAPRVMAIRRHTELLASDRAFWLHYYIIYRAPGVANGNIHFLLHAAVHPRLHCTEFDG